MRQGARHAEPSSNVRLGERHYIGKGAFVAVAKASRASYLQCLNDCITRTEVFGAAKERLDLEQALDRAAHFFRRAHKAGAKVIFVGNGGSAAIASHMAVDYTKNGGIRAIALNDAPTLTCLANDFGYENVFAKQIEYYAGEDDVVVIISSSGKSPNILAAAWAAHGERQLTTVTLSGMNPHNDLRTKGDLNFYVPCTDYGLVELTHLSLLHSVASVQ